MQGFAFRGEPLRFPMLFSRRLLSCLFPSSNGAPAASSWVRRHVLSSIRRIFYAGLCSVRVLFLAPRFRDFSRSFSDRVVCAGCGRLIFRRLLGVSEGCARDVPDSAGPSKSRGRKLPALMGLGNAGQPDGPDGRVYDRPQRRERQSDYRDGAALRGNVRREQEHGGQLQVADAARTARVPLQHYAAVEGELDEPGVQIQGPLKVHAQINYEQFPPVFIRFLARTTSAEGP